MVTGDSVSGSRRLTDPAVLQPRHAGHNPWSCGPAALDCGQLIIPRRTTDFKLWSRIWLRAKLFMWIVTDCRRCQPHMVYRSTAKKETASGGC